MCRGFTENSGPKKRGGRDALRTGSAEHNAQAKTDAVGIIRRTLTISLDF